MRPTFLPALSLALLASFHFVSAPLGAAEKPFHFAHRGGAHEFEELTLHAFQSTYDKGIRGYELDVRMLADGELVLLHDDKLDRTHLATGPVELLKTEQAKGIKTKIQGEPLLFLHTFLDFLKDKKGLYVEFEMKTSNKTLYPDERIEDYAKAIHKKVTAFIPEGSTYIFTSFDVRPLQAIKKIDPNADIMLIKGGPLTDELVQAAQDIGSKRVAAKMEGTTRLAVKKAQKQGMIVTGWPGHTMEDYFLGLGLGVNAICTDIPVQVQEYINSKK